MSLNHKQSSLFASESGSCMPKKALAMSNINMYLSNRANSSEIASFVFKQGPGSSALLWLTASGLAFVFSHKLLKYIHAPWLSPCSF